MIEEEQIAGASEEELSKLRLWLFKESVRLENEQISLDMRFEELEQFQLDAERELAAERAKFERERTQLECDRKKLEEEQIFFVKRLEILRQGFDELNGDKKRLERDRMRFEQERGRFVDRSYDREMVFFRGAEGPLAIRKRYKDLMKIYHPDNLHGDREIVDRINDEYNDCMRPYEMYKKA